MWQMYNELLLEQPAAGIRTFNRKNLELLKTVNEGNLGVIYQGKLTLSRKQKIDVMIKSITRRYFTLWTHKGTVPDERPSRSTLEP